MRFSLSSLFSALLTVALVSPGILWPQAHPSSNETAKVSPAQNRRTVALASGFPPAGRPDSESAQSLLGQGLKELQQARFEQAIEAFRRSLALNPHLLTARYDLGVSYFALGKFEESKRAFEEVLRESPGHRFATYFLGRIDLIEGNLERAIERFRSLPRDQPVADELYYLGSAYFRKGDTLMSIRTLERAAALKSGDYRVHLLLARAYQKTGHTAQANQQVALSESLRQAYRQKSREIIECNESLASEELSDAVERCRQLLDGGDPTKLVTLGVLLAERRLYDLALTPLAKAARLDSEDYEPQFNLGLTYFRMKKYLEARKPLEAAVALRPESYEAVALLGSVLFALGDDYNAAKQLRHAHQLRPNDDKVKALLFAEVRMIAQHLLSNKDYKEAIPYFEEALALEPDAAELRSQLAEARASLGNSEKAGREKKATANSNAQPN